MIKTKSIHTAAVHAGHKYEDQFGSHVAPIYQTSTFTFRNVDEGSKAFNHEEGGASHVYSRIGNPTVESLEAALCTLETFGMPDAEDYEALAFGSGMAAISTGIINLAKGKHIIAQKTLYGCTSQFLNEEAHELGMSVSFVNIQDLSAIENLLKEHRDTGLIYIESMANPTLAVADLGAISKLAKAYGTLIMVDNTFATSYHLQPFTYGVDAVVYSTTKYLSGHGTVVGGALISKKELFQSFKTRLFRKNMGGISGPFDAWLLLSGIKTFPLRMKQHAENAMVVARFLDEHPLVEKVFYPGLSSHPNHKLAKSIMANGFGGMISFEMKGGFEAGVHLMNNVKMISLAVSLGSVDSLIQHPASMTHSMVAPQIKKEAGITEGLVRISVGIEDPEDIISDLAQAMN